VRTLFRYIVVESMFTLLDFKRVLLYVGIFIVVLYRFLSCALSFALSAVVFSNLIFRSLHDSPLVQPTLKCMP